MATGINFSFFLHLKFYINPLPKNTFDIRDIKFFFSLDVSPISYNTHVFKKALATWQYAFCSTGIMFYDIFVWAKIKIDVHHIGLKVFFFSLVLPTFLFLSFCCSHWPSTRLGVNPSVPEGNFALMFSIKFLSIFMHTLTRSLWSANLGQRWCLQKWNKGKCSTQPITACTGINWLILKLYLKFYN